MPTSVAAIKRYITDREWIDDHYDMLADRYDKQYIAVADGRVLASASTIAALKTELANGALWAPQMPTVVYVTRVSDTLLL